MSEKIAFFTLPLQASQQNNVHPITKCHKETIFTISVSIFVAFTFKLHICTGVELSTYHLVLG